MPVFVLIETSWNVKKGSTSKGNSVNGINRNIVECKVGISSIISFSDSVLIETSWNVKIFNGSGSGS